MALQFLSDAEVEDAELVIALDVEGLHALLKALETALRSRIEDPVPEPVAGGVPLNAFGKVTITFAKAAQDDTEPRAATAFH